MGWLSRLCAPSVADYARLSMAVILLVTIRFAIMVVPFSRFRSALVRLGRGVGRVVPGSPTPSQVVWAVRVADWYLPGHRTCLMRSLSAEVLLVLYGLSFEHRIGVELGDGDLKAHSWIERDGEILIGDLPDLSRYTPLPSLEGVDEL